jgi:hypothetical protein
MAELSIPRRFEVVDQRDHHNPPPGKEPGGIRPPAGNSLARELALVGHGATTHLQPAKTPDASRSASVRRRKNSAIRFEVLDWSGLRLGPPAIVSSGPTVRVPPTGQIQISALVTVNGDSDEHCRHVEVGTTQTAWVAWTKMWYQGRTRADGSMTATHRPPMPMRDPSGSGSVWYDVQRVRRASQSGDSLGIIHADSPYHDIPKSVTNNAVAGRPLNFLRSYSSGLHLVTYLTARVDGRFLARPLRFMYWNSVQDFNCSPNYSAPLKAWGYSGTLRTNLGASGEGPASDAPYYTTVGPTINAHSSVDSNWKTRESAL